MTNAYLHLSDCNKALGTTWWWLFTRHQLLPVEKLHDMHCYKYELSVVPFWLVIPFVCSPPRGFRLSVSVKINSGINNLSKIRCIQNVLGALRPTHLHDYCIYFALPRVLACHIICMSRYVLRRRHSASARSSPSAPCAAPVCLATQF